MPRMTSFEMNKLAGLYSELDMRLEQGEAESPELDRLFDEVSDLLNKDVDVWFHFDPAGMAQLVVHLVPEHRAADGKSGCARVSRRRLKKIEQRGIEGARPLEIREMRRGQVHDAPTRNRCRKHVAMAPP